MNFQAMNHSLNLVLRDRRIYQSLLFSDEIEKSWIEEWVFVSLLKNPKTTRFLQLVVGVFKDPFKKIKDAPPLQLSFIYSNIDNK